MKDCWVMPLEQVDVSVCYIGLKKHILPSGLVFTLHVDGWQDLYDKLDRGGNGEPHFFPLLD